MEILDECGLASTSIEAIADRARTGKATIYRWWPDKTAVVIEALRDAVAQHLPFPHTGDLYQDVRLYLQNVFKSLQGYRGRVFKAFLIAAQNDAELAGVFQTIWCEPRRQEVKIGLGKYRDSALRGNLDFDVVLDTMYGSMYNRFLLGPKSVSAEYVEALADVILSGIATRSAERERYTPL